MTAKDGSVPAYVQVDGSSVYALPEGSGYDWCGYVLPQGVDPPSATLTPDQAFNDQDGHFLFASGEPEALKADAKAFANSLYALLSQVTNNNFVGRAMLWLPQSQLPAAQDFNRYGIRFAQGFSPNWTVQNNLNIPLGSDLIFYINYGCFVSYDATLNAIRFNTGPVTTRSMGYKHSLTGDSGLDMPNDPRQAFLLLTGNHSGSLLFTTTYDPGKALTYFQTGFGYSVNNQGQQQALFYPVFNAGEIAATPLNLTSVLDLLDTTNTAMSDDALAAGWFRSGYVFPTGVELVSWFRTVDNHTITLCPLGGTVSDGQPAAFAGGLVFYETSTVKNGKSTFGMTPAGEYGLAVSGYQNPSQGQQMLCGLFGMEWIGFAPYDATASQEKNDRLRFLPCQGAYAPVFPFANADLTNPNSGNVVPRLNTTYRAAWANLVAGASTPVYSAQPQGSALYGDPAGSDVTLLSSQPPTTTLPATAGFAFPLVPYAGVTTAPAGLDLNSFESEILAASRKNKISQIATAQRQQVRTAHQVRRLAQAKATTPPPRITTPQGLLVDLVDPTDVAAANNQAAYESVLLARSKQNDGTVVDFALQNPTTDMMEALQTNQLFLVGVNPAPFNSDGASFANRVVINDWTFVADIGDGAQATSYRNVMIMKFCSGSLKQRVTNPNRWTMPDSFSLIEGAQGGMSGLAYTGLSQWLQNYIEDAEAKAALEPGGLYANFVKLVNNPNWNGIIVFNANMPLDALPAQIEGIAAGIDYSRFFAHHFGASVSRVEYKEGTLDVQGISNLFGLIDYQNPAYEAAIAAGAAQGTSIYQPTANGYAFTVLQLQVLFMQSRMVTFNSYIQLNMDTLFGSTITSTQFAGQASPVNTMVLKGTALRQNNATTYIFEQTGGYLFGLDSNVLLVVAVNRVQFNTLGTSDDGATTASRFLMWGRLNFALLETGGVVPGPFDLLSFGADDGETPGNQGLAYANLSIGMSFPTATPNATSFAFNTSHLSFDLVGSTLRDQSLFKGFALQLKGFIAASEGQQPKDYNFLTVQPQGVSLKTLAGDWYGITYKVTMGTPGALVSGAGFESDLLLAWSPASTAKDGTAAVFVGLSLPGAAPGASVLSLQGVIKLSTGPIKLLYQDVPGGTAGEKFFNLQLTDIGIKVLGIAKLPPGATIQFFLFGDPSNTGSLGWYAAYVQDQKSQNNTPSLTSP